MRITENGTVIDLDGKTLNESIEIRGPVRDVTIRNGTIKGEIRLRPNRIEGNTEPGHTDRIREVAPTNITVRGITFDTDGSTHQIYFGPGSTSSRIINCNFSAETGERREVLSVDGSEGNFIAGNNFRQCTWGGIFVYRNCGEKGTVRHQKPQNNTISNNTFNLSGMPLLRISNRSGHQGSFIFVPYGIILGSRQGGSSYCELDNMYDVGSGKSDLDYARNNTLEGNKFSGDWFRRHILDNDKNNVIK